MNSKDKTAHYEPILRPTPLWTQIFNQSQASTDFKGDLPAWAPQSRARDFSDRGKTGPAGTEQSASGGEAETSTAYGQDRAAVSKQRAYDHLTLEKLYEDPAADPAALWIASRTVHALDRPDVLDPLIELLLDKMISEPLADIETKRMPGDLSRRPVKTMRPQNLADYETFEDLIDLPTGHSRKRRASQRIFFVFRRAPCPSAYHRDAENRGPRRMLRGSDRAARLFRRAHAARGT
jgi:hypothetical protein